MPYVGYNAPDQPVHSWSDQGHHCPFTASMANVEYITKTEGPDQTVKLQADMNGPSRFTYDIKALSPLLHHLL